jgi:hypothetical protein
MIFFIFLQKDFHLEVSELIRFFFVDLSRTLLLGFEGICHPIPGSDAGLFFADLMSDPGVFHDCSRSHDKVISRRKKGASAPCVQSSVCD